MAPHYHAAFTQTDKTLVNKPIEELVQEVQGGSLSATAVLQTYGKIAVKAQEKTNCVTEILLPEAETWAQNEVNLKGPLAGVPISLKDSIQVKGFDTTLGYSRLAGKPYAEDGPLVKLLKDAGWLKLPFLFVQHARGVLTACRRGALCKDRPSCHAPVLRVGQPCLGSLP